LRICATAAPNGLAHVDDTPDPQSPGFYRFAILTLVWSAALAAYGIFVFDANP